MNNLPSNLIQRAALTEIGAVHRVATIWCECSQYLPEAIAEAERKGKHSAKLLLVWLSESLR